ncbi:SWIM zinc finger family protein [Streptomyces sp. OF3]|uniref:SWIM zinc finger family protein n=1 Tax=Streptomyces alkaliterrae TaxID=2213162 RepID=A0A7W3ZNU4_9ACTN|nr:SWIM zinc finger family protein [Streptomyces alkaliterrae]MBB1255073.1 SWIM zinc finger family protein [Streptomyces alkaliterrae]
MTGQQVRWTAERLLALAPDAASRRAGEGLAAADHWSDTGEQGETLWGLCQGGGGRTYRTAVDLAGPAYRCDCPSRKSPCKHALGLLLLSAGSGTPAADARRPEWVVRWAADRRARTDAPTARQAGRVPADPEAARRRAERRAARIAAGAEELEQRLIDLIRVGLAGAERADGAGWEETAARMVDAQAPGLASRVRELAAVPASGPGWPARLLAECALLHLLVRAAARTGSLPDPLAATVRARLGVGTESSMLLADEEALVGGRFLVLGRREDQEGRLAVRRIWLRRLRCGRPALLLSYGAGGRPPELDLPVGAVMDAELAYHPGGAPLRAALGRRSAAAPGPVPDGIRPAEALAAYGEAVRHDPWLTSWPVVLAGVVPIPGEGGEGWQLAESDGEDALPLHRATGAGRWTLAAVSGGDPVTVFGECGPEGFVPHTVWSEGEAVML